MEFSNWLDKRLRRHEQLGLERGIEEGREEFTEWLAQVAAAQETIVTLKA